MFFIYSILAVFLLSDIKSGQIINADINFSNFGMAFLTLFKCSTGENWYLIMFDTMKTKSSGCIVGQTCGHSNFFNFFFIYKKKKNIFLLF